MDAEAFRLYLLDKKVGSANDWVFTQLLGFGTDAGLGGGFIKPPS